MHHFLNLRTIARTAQKITKIAIPIALIILAIAAIWYAFKILTFNSAPESESKAWLDTSEILLIVSAIALVIGLIGEWPDSELWKAGFAYKVAKSLVIIGCVGELLGDAGIFVTSRHLQLLQDIAVTVATDRATDAGLEAAAANVAAGEANEKAARLTAENLKLEKAIAPRRLLADDMDALTEGAKSFPDRQISIWSYGLDVEGRLLAMQIKSALEAAHAPIIDRIGAMLASSDPRVGVVITGPDAQLVSMLLTALKPLSPVQTPFREGHAMFGMGPTVAAVPAEIFVGIKPINP